MWDVDSDAAQRKRAARRRRKREQWGGSGGGDGGGRTQRVGRKRSRNFPGTTSESDGDNLRDDRKKKVKVVGDGVATAVPGSAPAPRRRLVKPLGKRTSGLVAGREERHEVPPRLLEDASSSESDGGSRRPVRTGKRVAARQGTGKRTDNKGPAKAKPGGEGVGGGVDLLGTLIGNRAPQPKRGSSSATAPASARQPQVSRPTLSKQRSTDSLEGPTSGGAAAPAVVGSSDAAAAAATPLSLKQYKTGIARRNDALPLGGGITNAPASRIPMKAALATTKKAGVALNSLLGKKRGPDDMRVRQKTPASRGSSSGGGGSDHGGTINSSGAAPAPQGRGKSQYEKVTQFVGVYRKRSNGKYFVWVNDQLFDGTEYGRWGTQKLRAQECRNVFVLPVEL